MNVIVEGIKGFWAKVPAFRDVRTSALIFGGMVVVVLNTVLADLKGEYPEAWWLVLGVAIGGFMTALVKLCDDGGESDAVKIAKMFLESGSK